LSRRDRDEGSLLIKRVPPHVVGGASVRIAT
jgi:hypothetical protein